MIIKIKNFNKKNKLMLQKAFYIQEIPMKSLYTFWIIK